MSLDLQRYQELKETVQKLQTEKDKAAGALDQLKKRLVDEFECHSFQDAVKLLEKLKEQLNEAKEEYEETLQEFERTYGDIL